MNLLDKHCTHAVAPLSSDAVADLLPHVAGWAVIGNQLSRSFSFKDYHETLAFVNALAWVIHQQDHHPELLVTYNRCVVSFSTHSAGDAITENDFICAAKANALYAQRPAA